MSLIRLKNVTRKYEDPARLVLKDVFFRVAAGAAPGARKREMIASAARNLDEWNLRPKTI